MQCFGYKSKKKKKHPKITLNSRTDALHFNPSASTAERSIPTAQMKLKRARLADDLNEKIALRPGPLELVEKNILPVDSAVKEAIKGSYNKWHASLRVPRSEGSHGADRLVHWGWGSLARQESCCGLLSQNIPHSQRSWEWGRNSHLLTLQGQVNIDHLCFSQTGWEPDLRWSSKYLLYRDPSLRSHGPH